MAIDEGQKTIHYLGNPKLKRANVNLKFTQEEILEYQKCSEDPLYFIENYVKIVNIDRGLIPFDMYDYQKRMIDTFDNNRYVVAKLPRQSGKCFSINTYITVRNRNTGLIENITVGEFYERTKKEKSVYHKLQRLWSGIQKWITAFKSR